MGLEPEIEAETLKHGNQKIIQWFIYWNYSLHRRF